MTTDLTALIAGLTAGTLVGIGFITIVVVVLLVVADWIVFKKAGQKGWASLIPFYRDYVNFKIMWGNGWLFIVPIILSLVSGDGVVGAICGLLLTVIHALNAYKRATAFGKGIGFAIGLFFFPPIFHMILAFGSAQYLGVPQDGFSYKQLKARVQGRDEQRQANMQYEDPDQ